MQPDPDELAGVADLFGALTRGELRTAFADLAARSGTDFDPDEVDAAIDEAVAGYYLVVVEASAVDGLEPGVSEDELLASGPTALPRLPEGGEDLPHLIDAEARSIDRVTLGEAAHARLRGDAARAVNDGDGERIATLLDVCYDLEAWAPVETADLRDQLDGAL